MGLFTGPEPPLPLAERLRPKTFAEVVGQKDLVGEHGWLRQAAASGEVSSVVLYGPPGTGKTTIARLLADAVKAVFRMRHATDLPLTELRPLLDEGRRARAQGVRFLLMIDEIHRLNRVQQDALLPYLEEGSVLLVGATTENPYYDLAPALRSRVRLARLLPLGEEELASLLERALTHRDGLAALRLSVSEEARRLLIRLADGDGRRLLNILEDVARTKRQGETVEAEDLRAFEGALRYGDPDEHYASISAFIKSVRGGDADAALVWLAKMLAGGEMPRYVARRLVILASEDVGLADPHALPVAWAAAEAVEFVGMPEAAIILAHATIYLAQAKKSRTVIDALRNAEAFVAEHGSLAVPRYLANPTRAEQRDLGLPTYRLPTEGGNGQDYWPEGVPRTTIVPRAQKDA